MSEEIREELLYSPTHQWARIEGDSAVIGITDYAQKSLGEATWVEPPEIGARIAQGETLATIESVKATSDVISSVSGEVIEVNVALTEDPNLCNRDPYGAGWIARVKLEGEPKDLLSAKEYAALKKD